MLAITKFFGENSIQFSLARRIEVKMDVCIEKAKWWCVTTLNVVDTEPLKNFQLNRRLYTKKEHTHTYAHMQTRRENYFSHQLNDFRYLHWILLFCCCCCRTLFCQIKCIILTHGQSTHFQHNSYCFDSSDAHCTYTQFSISFVDNSRFRIRT